MLNSYRITDVGLIRLTAISILAERLSSNAAIRSSLTMPLALSPAFFSKNICTHKKN